jgi:hypothetical protein
VASAVNWTGPSSSQCPNCLAARLRSGRIRKCRPASSAVLASAIFDLLQPIFGKSHRQELFSEQALQIANFSSRPRLEGFSNAASWPSSTHTLFLYNRYKVCFATTELLSEVLDLFAVFETLGCHSLRCLWMTPHFPFIHCRGPTFLQGVKRLDSVAYWQEGAAGVAAVCCEL